MTKVNNIFSGKIDGSTPYQKYGEVGRLDRKNGKLSDRLDNVNKILEEDDFFLDYFDNYYNPEISQDSALSEENNISQMLSSMADYLINSDESREMEKENKTEYVFTDKIYDKKENYRNKKLNAESINEDKSNIAYVSSPKKPVKFKNDILKIEKKDMSTSGEMSKILSDYNLLLQRLDYLAGEHKNFSQKYNAMKSSVLDDMKMVKESYLGIFPRSKKVPHGHYVKPVPEFDYSDIKMLRRIMSTMPVRLEDNYESWENSFDYNWIIRHAGLTESELIIAIFRPLGWTNKELIDDFNLYSDGYNIKNDKDLANNQIRKIHTKIKKYLENKNE